MGNLNAEQVKKALGWAISEEICENCLCTVYGKSMTSFLNEVLAIINSQEQRIKELEQCLEHEHASFMEIFAEIEKEIEAAIESNYRAKREHYNHSVIPNYDNFNAMCDGKIYAMRGLLDFIAELKKKYTEEGK